MVKQAKIPILMYHSIAHPQKGAPLKCLHVPLGRFRHHMQLLKRLGYRALSMPRLLPYLRGEKQGKVVGLTFDDGYRNNLEVLPILRAYGFSATCYLVGDLLGQHNKWDECKNIPYNPLMSEGEVRQWLASGMSIGAHTRHHVDLRALDDAQAQDEIGGVKTQLEVRFGVPVADFCYPYGYYTPRDVALVKAAGYQTATTTRRSRVYVGEDPLLELPRVTINNNAYPHTFLLKILSHYEDRRGC